MQWFIFLADWNFDSSFQRRFGCRFIRYGLSSVLALNPPGGGSTVPSGAQWYRAGSDQSIVAQPTSGYNFQNWSVSPLSSISVLNSSSASTSATINGAGTITANFSIVCNPGVFAFVNAFYSHGIDEFLIRIAEKEKQKPTYKKSNWVK